MVFAVQEQSEDEQLILVLLFHAKVLWVCFVLFFRVFLTPLYSRLGLVMKTLCFSTEYLNSLSFKREYRELKWLNWTCLCFFMQLARKVESHKTSSYHVTIHTHLWTTCIELRFYTHRPWTTATLQHLNPHLVSEKLTACRVIHRLMDSLAPPISKCQNLWEA